MPVTTEFKDWALGYAGCDGGDPGTASNPSVWVCGIEWGGGHDAAGLRSHLRKTDQHPPGGYDSWQKNLSWIFNWQIMKLLAVMNERPLKAYKQFAKEVEPFVMGAKGYFKLNLYPIAFRTTNQKHWINDFAPITGFSTKQEYVDWCAERRLPKIREWSQFHSPELVICLGKTYRDVFATTFAVSHGTWETEIIDDRELCWAINEYGTLIFVLPFMVNRNGLVRNASIQKFGERISQIRNSQILNAGIVGSTGTSA